MTNTSATGGPLLPDSGTDDVNSISNTSIGDQDPNLYYPLPLTDDALDHIFHDLFMGITGLDATLIRPRWQRQPGNMPPSTTTWMAHGVEARRYDVYSDQDFIPDVGIVVSRTQELDNLVSIYGPQMDLIEIKLRNGLDVYQNMDLGTENGIVLVEVGLVRNTSILINGLWQKKIDVKITFRRKLVTVYPVKSIVGVDYEIITKNGISEDIVVTI